MDNTQADITADLTDERLQQAAARDYRSRSNSDVPRRAARYRAVAALAREGWQPIQPNPLPAAEGEAQELAKQFCELAEVLTRTGFYRMGNATTTDSWPSRLQRAAELLEHPQALERVPARLRRCPTHGQQGAEAWGRPECVQEMRNELVEAREALRRLRRWGGLANDSGFDGAALQSVVQPVMTWINGGMKGPLPPLPAWLGQPLLTEETPK